MQQQSKPNIYKQLLERKASNHKARAQGIIADSDLSRQFGPGEKPQPIIRRGGRNRSGKP